MNGPRHDEQIVVHVAADVAEALRGIFEARQLKPFGGELHGVVRPAQLISTLDCERIGIQRCHGALLFGTLVIAIVLVRGMLPQGA